eukprot:9503464-Pyramimonas_sp.AAC.1
MQVRHANYQIATWHQRGGSGRFDTAKARRQQTKENLELAHASETLVAQFHPRISAVIYSSGHLGR